MYKMYINIELSEAKEGIMTVRRDGGYVKMEKRQPFCTDGRKCSKAELVGGNKAE